jgi:Domain of unknown function (DUF4397)
MRAIRRLPVPAVVVATGAILLSPAGASAAQPSSHLRFLHAIPGAPAANVVITGGSGVATPLNGTGFGQVSPSVAEPTGSVTVTVSAGGQKVGSATESLAGGASYTLVAEGTAKAPRFKLYRAGRAVPGKASVRAVHAAPEMGTVQMTLGDKPWGSVGFGQDTGYKTAEPGTYEAKAMMPGDKSPIVDQKGVHVGAGTASTAYAVGSGGQRTRFVLVQDAVAAPSGAPETGLGGMSSSDGTPWIAALLAALGAGVAGGLLYTRTPLGRGRARG